MDIGRANLDDFPQATTIRVAGAPSADFVALLLFDGDGRPMAKFILTPADVPVFLSQVEQVAAGHVRLD